MSDIDLGEEEEKDCRPLIIGLAGKARVGKDTVADILQKLTGFDRYSFATPMKEMIKVGLGLDDKDTQAQAYDRSYRHIAQTLGTEWGRNLICKDIWIRIAERRIAGKCVIISDIRTEDEAEFVRKYGILIHVLRNVSIKDSIPYKEATHISEAGIEDKIEDLCLPNNCSLDALRESCEHVIEHIYLYRDRFRLYAREKLEL